MTSGTSPWEGPEPRGLRVLQGALRVIVALQCWGAGAGALQDAAPSGPVHLLQGTGVLAESFSLAADRAAAAGLVVVGLVALVRPAWPLLLGAAAWFSAEAAASVLAPEDAWDVFSPAEHLVQVAAPISLALLDWWPPKFKFSLGRFLVGLWSLRQTAALSTIAQGLKTLWDEHSRPQLVTLLDGAVACLGGAPLKTGEHTRWLGLLGGVDIGLALAFMAVRSRGVAGLLIGWSLLRVGAWTLAFGAEGYAETLVRSAQVGGPLVLLLYWVLTVRETPPTILPAAKK